MPEGWNRVMWLVWFLCVLFFVFGGILIWGGLKQRSQTRDILARGVIAQVRVIQTHSEGRHRRRFYYADYEFEVDGQIYRHQEAYRMHFTRTWPPVIRCRFANCRKIRPEQRG